VAPDAGYLPLLPSPTTAHGTRATRLHIIYTLISTRSYINIVHAYVSAMYTPHGGNIRVSIYAYICTISPAVPHRCIHSIMLSGETRLSRILKGFNNIWKLLPKSWRSSSSLRYVLGATLGIRPIHLPSPLCRRIPKVSGACGLGWRRTRRRRAGREERRGSPSFLLLSYSVHKLSLGEYDTRSDNFNFSA